MPKSKPPRGKKYYPGMVPGNKIVATKPKWMRIAKTIGIVLLSAFLLMAIAGMIVKYYNHINYHK